MQMPAVVAEHGTGQAAHCVLRSHRRSLQHSTDADPNKTPSSARTELFNYQNDQSLHLQGRCPAQPSLETWESQPAPVAGSFQAHCLQKFAAPWTYFRDLL